MSCARYIGCVGVLATTLGIGLVLGPSIGEAIADNPGGQSLQHSAHHRATAPGDGLRRDASPRSRKATETRLRALSVASTATAGAQPAGQDSPALIMTGTGMPVVDQTWMDMAVRNFIRPATGGGSRTVAITTPEEFSPFTGLADDTLDKSVADGVLILQGALRDDSPGTQRTAGAAPASTVVFGYSQSSLIATVTKQDLAGQAAQGQAVPNVQFVLVANPARPNGGLSSRFPGLGLPGWTFGPPTPTDTPFPTIDVARQYDFFADFPRYPLNLLADLNVVVGLFLGSHDYRRVTLDPTDPNYDPATIVQQVGDTTYYLIPDPHLPLLKPLRAVGFPSWFVDSLEPVLRSIVELGYDRTTPYGQPAPAILLPTPDQRLQLPGNSIDCQSFGVEAPGTRLLCV